MPAWSSGRGQIHEAGEEPPKGFSCDEQTHPPRLGQGRHTGGEVVQQILTGPEQFLPRILSDHLEHPLARVRLQVHPRPMHRRPDPASDPRNRQHVLVQRGSRERAEEVVFPNGASRPISDADGQDRGVYRPEHPTCRAGPGEHQDVAVLAPVEGDPVEDATGDLVATQQSETQAGRLVGAAVVEAMAEEGEAPVHEPLDQSCGVLHVSLVPVGRMCVDELGGHRPRHLDEGVLVDGDVPYVVKHGSQLRHDLLRFVDRHRVDIDTDPQLGRRAGPRLSRLEYLDESA